MTCGEAREYLVAFLDNELDAALSIELQRHLDGCARCAREAEIEQTVRKRLAAAVDADDVERANLDAVMNSVRAIAPTAARARSLSGVRVWRRRSAAAAILVIGAGAWLMMRDETDEAPAIGLADLLVGDFEHFLEGGETLQIASGDREEVATWLRGRTAVAVALPQVDRSTHELRGGRRCTLDGRPAAFAVYDVKGVPVSMVVVAGGRWRLAKMSAMRYGDMTVRADRCKGYTVVACRRGALVYAAVSTLAREDLLGLITGAVHESD